MKFEVIVKDGIQQKIDASTPEMAYRGVCSFYMPETPVTIRDVETGECHTYTRILDNAGNLKDIITYNY